MFNVVVKSQSASRHLLSPLYTTTDVLPSYDPFHYRPMSTTGWTLRACTHESIAFLKYCASRPIVFSEPPHLSSGKPHNYRLIISSARRPLEAGVYNLGAVLWVLAIRTSLPSFLLIQPSTLNIQ